MRRFVFLLVPIVVVLLSGCDMLGIESPEAMAAAREAEGKAVGGACRHAGRAIEDCYALNRKAEKAAVFAGWRDMNDYMRENKIEAVMPQLVAQTAGAGSKATAEDKAEATTAEKAEKRPPKSAAVSKPKSKGPDS